MSELTFVCWKWKPPAGYRSSFGPETVNTWASMISRHYKGAHKFVCVTDDSAGIDSSIKTVPLWSDYSDLPSPHGQGYPSCYRRLRMFHRDAASWFGERFVSMDLDVVITGDITEMFSHDHPIKMWGDTARNTPYNGSLVQLKAGSRTKVWDTFDPIESPKKSLALGYIGSDQGWIGACLGPNEPKWTMRDGVYSFRNHIQRTRNRLPSNAKIVVFHGAIDPWCSRAQALPWVREHYR